MTFYLVALNSFSNCITNFDERSLWLENPDSPRMKFKQKKHLFKKNRGLIAKRIPKTSFISNQGNSLHMLSVVSAKIVLGQKDCTHKPRISDTKAHQGLLRVSSAFSGQILLYLSRGICSTTVPQKQSLLFWACCFQTNIFPNA